MRKLTTTLCQILAVFLGSAGCTQNSLIEVPLIVSRCDFPSALCAGYLGAQALGAVAVLTMGRQGPSSPGDPSDLTELEPLAEQGDADAQFNLGKIYDYGQGVSENDKTAVKWYRLAAEQGHTEAQFNLGMMYDAGEGVEEDKFYAYVWYSLAATNGHGAISRDALAKKMTRYQIAKAKNLAAECVRKNYKGC